jgi:hypothetical protein
VAAVFARTEAAADVTPEALWTHEEVVEDLMRCRAVLPMRFGTRFRDEDAVLDLLSARGGEFARVLDGVRGRVELGVRVAGEAAAPVAKPSSGSEYMTQRLDARREAQRVARAVHAPLARRAERSTADLAPARGGVLTGSYLLPGDGVDAFAADVRRLQRAYPSLAITCTGPWPPYSFVEESPR